MCRKKFNHEYRLVVALEPLLNNASITTASHLKLYNGDILVFQRNNSLLQGKGLNIDLILANYSMVFCIECLQLLWDQRARVWLAAASVSDHRGIDRGLSAVSQTCSEDRGIVHNGFAAGEERGADVAADEAEGSVEGEGAQHNIVGVKHSPSATPRHGGQSGGVDSGADLELPVATADARSFTHNVPQLDGHVSDSSDEDSYQDSDQENINPQTLDNFPTTSNILHNLGPIMAANTTTWAPINKSDADSIDLDRTDGSSSGEDADYSDFEEHSSDIDRASSDVNHADTANTSQLHQQWDLPSWTAINQPSTTQPVVTIAEETTGASDEYWEFGEQDLLTDAVPFQGTFDRPRIPVTWPPPPLENRRTGVAFPGSPTADAVVESPGEQHGANLPWRPSRLEILQRVETALYGGPSELDELQRESTPLPASPIKTIFCPVAQSPVTPTNQETAPGATLADQRYAPSLCHCRRPAGTAKMAKCSNPKCHIQWYHYLCLSKGPKISYSRTRKTRAPWLCEVCKFKVRHPEAFDTVEHYVPANINFIRKSHIDSIVSDLGIPGRVGHIENPYGLASMQYCNRLRQVPREEESSSHTDTAEPVESEEESEEEHEEESNEEYALYPAPPDLEGDPFGFALVSRFVPRDDRSKRQKLNTVQELLQNNNPNRDGGCTSNVTDAKLIDHDSEDTVLGNDSSPAGNEETLVGPENTPTAKEMPEQKRKFDNSSSSHTDSSPLAKKGMGNRSDAFMSGALPPAEYAQHQHQDKSSRINRFEALMSGTAPSGAQDKGVEDVLMD